MLSTEELRSKHQELLQLASEISEKLDAAKLTQDAKEVRSLLSILAGKLRMHLVAEDTHLYPELLRHQDETVRARAKEFIDEMGSISTVFKKYVDRWPHSQAIQENPSDFISETKGLFTALADRIDREDNELYKLVDSIAK